MQEIDLRASDKDLKWPRKLPYSSLAKEYCVYFTLLPLMTG